MIGDTAIRSYLSTCIVASFCCLPVGCAVSFVPDAPLDETIRIWRGNDALFGEWQHYYQISAGGKVIVSVRETHYKDSKNGLLVPDVHFYFSTFSLPPESYKKIVDLTRSERFRALQKSYRNKGVNHPDIFLIEADKKLVGCYGSFPDSISDAIKVVTSDEFAKRLAAGRQIDEAKTTFYFNQGLEFRKKCSAQ